MPSKVKKPALAKAPKLHIRKGDQVVVLSGDNRGKTGTVIKVFPAQLRAIVDGEAGAYETKHVRANPQANVEGGRIRRLRPVHISKLALVDPTTNKAATRVRHQRTDKGVVRVARTSGHQFASK